MAGCDRLCMAQIGSSEISADCGTEGLGTQNVNDFPNRLTKSIHNRFNYLRRKFSQYRKERREYKMGKINPVYLSSSDKREDLQKDKVVIPNDSVAAVENMFQVLIDEADGVGDQELADTLSQDPGTLNNQQLNEYHFVAKKQYHKLRNNEKCYKQNKLLFDKVTPLMLTPIIEQNEAVDDEVFCDMTGTQTETETSGTQTVESSESEDVKDLLFRPPKRTTINKIVKNVKYYKTFSKLYYHLRCKYFMKTREIGLINNLVTEARIWMKSKDFSCDSELDYSILTSAVMCAFCVDSNELEFRSYMKDPTNFDNMIHLNKTLSGDLGKSYGKLLGKYRETSLAGSFLPSLRMPGTINMAP